MIVGMELYDTRRKSVILGEPVGHGGEAMVYRVKDRPGWLAKIYTTAPRPEYAGKLAWMQTHPPENPTQAIEHPSLAWPAELLYDSRRRLAGYLMPFIQGAVPVLDVFNPRRRAATLPQFDRRYLHRAARNLSAALNALHMRGYVIGDLNESNVLVTPSALVTLIDTDSFQVKEERGLRPVVHFCPVGKPEYTPPELQASTTNHKERNPDHDAFGMAVLIFQLLMEGNHPFRAQWLGSGEPPPLEARIAQGLFPYSVVPSRLVIPPANAPEMNSLHPKLAELFRRCFVDGQRDPRWRPGPALWARAISEAEESLILCRNGHYFSGHVSDCPICAREAEAAGKKQDAARTAGQAEYTRGWFRRGRPAPPSPASRVNPAPQASPTAATRVQAASQTNPAPQVQANVRRQAGNPTPGAASVPGTAWQGRPAARQRVPTHPGVQGSVKPSTAFTPQPPGGFFTGLPPIFNRRVPAGAGPSSTASNWPWGSFPRYNRQLTPRLSFWDWFRPRLFKSAYTGGALGAFVGILPGALLAAGSTAIGHPVAWNIVWMFGGAAGGMLRGWNPGNRTGIFIRRRLGWERFWKIAGLLCGGALGFAASLPFIYLIFPLFVGPVIGAWAGLEGGQRIWHAGRRVGWERIWTVAWTLGAAMSGMGLAFLASAGPPGAWLGQLAMNIRLWMLAQNASEPTIILALGALGGLLGGALAGFFGDLFARIAGLVD